MGIMWVILACLGEPPKIHWYHFIPIVGLGFFILDYLEG